ncbi:MAG: hypothetical protein JNK22_02125 [Rhodocyclaceae bacterium]|nr:hypothetical protein [Rhodocyclaceae bacterium]
MRVVGKEPLPPASNQPTAANLEAADLFMAQLRGLCGGPRRYFPKGVYRYRSHEEADLAVLAFVARDMANLMIEREHGAGKVRA